MRIELGIPLRLSKIASAISGQLVCKQDAEITHISTDSRETKAGDLFIALRGKNYDGADYTDSASEKGAFILSSVKCKSDIFHVDTRQALLDLAAFYAQNLPYLLYKIGITGSVGKTTTKEFLKTLLSEKYITHASAGNFNNEIGLPLSILTAKKNTQILLMEMGMNGRGEISRLSKCLRPDIAVITNVGTAHIGRLGSREEIAKAKLEIIDGMNGGKVIVPKEEPLLANAPNKSTFSTLEKDADLYIKREKGKDVLLYKNGELLCTSTFALKEEHHLRCLAAAVAVAIKTGFSADELSHAIPLISKYNTRQKEVLTKGYHFYDDCYNASRESMLAAIYEFQKRENTGKRSLLLGEILELGERRFDIHFEIGASISPRKTDRLFLFGEHAEEIGIGSTKNGFPPERIYLNRNTERPEITADQIKRHCETGEHILIKGSRGVRLERILQYFTDGEEGRKNE